MAARDGDKPIVILGGGLTGGNAAVALREEGFDGPVLLVGREPGVPFGRPPLSKTYLRSEEDLDGWLVKPEAWYRQHDVERLVETGVAAVNAAAHTLVLDSGKGLDYRKLLIATGGRNRRLGIPGDELAGVHYLRTLAECEAIQREVGAGRRAMIVGMGFIGCEVMASLTQLGVKVTAVAPGQAPLEGVLGAEVGAVFAAIHRTHGVELLNGQQIVAFEGGDRVQTAVTGNGNRIACDFVVVGIGIEPVIPNFTGPGVTQSNGILVDELCRTSLPDIYAAGDVANHLHPIFGRIRVEHYNNAEKQGRAAASSMLGSSAPYDYVHSFWSDQYEHKLEYVGHAASWDEFVVRGGLKERQLVGFYLRAGLLQAAVGLDRGGDPELDADSEMAACARLVGERARPAPASLADEHVDLWSLVSRA
jgi:3-phenylpropionate/trans-cinnamate dioxygenase ferredoxin reductase subunit